MLLTKDGDIEPKITHGYTLTTNIKFTDVLRVLKESAFKTSPYPIILSIENHCSEKMQKIMIDNFKAILEKIYVVNPDRLPKEFPSPNDLKYHFLIKVIT